MLLKSLKLDARIKRRKLYRYFQIGNWPVEVYIDIMLNESLTSLEE